MQAFTFSEYAGPKKIRTEFQSVLDFLKKHEIRHLVVEKTDRLLRNFYDYIKIEEMIFINFAQSDILPFPVKFDKNLLHSIAEFARDREYDSINLKDYQIRKIIKLAKKTGLEKVFYLSDIVGHPLSDHDINALYTKWKKEDGDSILLHQFVDKVYTRWCEEKDLLSTYQLSYFFKHDDIIHDAVPFFGKIDDLIVLSW